MSELRLNWGSGFLSAVLTLLAAAAAAQGIPDEVNVSAIGANPPGGGVPDPGLKQQNEPWCIKKPANPLHAACFFNDYRGVDNPLIGDTWQGWSWTINGGETWFSDLLPGHPGDSPNLGLAFTADPAASAAPGVAIVSYLASNRGEFQPSGIYTQRLFEVNREAGAPWIPEMLPKRAIWGWPGRFTDKPVQLLHPAPPGSGTVTVSSTLKDGTTVTREAPAARLFLGYSVFVGNRSHLMVAWSDDYGETFRRRRLSEAFTLNQSASIAAHGKHVCAVWRRFEREDWRNFDHNESRHFKNWLYYKKWKLLKRFKKTDAIMYSCSRNLGRRWSRARELVEAPDFFPFDQGTTETTFRTNSYPYIVSDGSTFYAIWASRISDVSPFFARIVYTISTNNGKTWSEPQRIDDAPLGHQFMPSLAVARGTVRAMWYDTRRDNFQQVFVQDVLDPASGDPATKVIRQIADLRTAELTPAGPTASVQVSRYLSGVRPGTSGPEEQLQFNTMNDRMFLQGTVPFDGDYPHVAYPTFRVEDGEWVSNVPPDASGRLDDALASFTDNRNVGGNTWENLSDPTVYTPVSMTMANAESGRPESVPPPNDARADGVADPTDDYPACVVDGRSRERTRNQDIYTSVIRPGVSVESPSADKPTGAIQRAHVIWISNNTPTAASYTVTIDDQPPDAPDTGRASFLQVPVAPFNVNDPTGGGLLTEIIAHIDPNSTVARTVFITSEIPDVPITVSVSDGGTTVLGSVTLNTDPRAPDVQNPDVQNPDVQNPDVQNAEVHNPDVQNPVVTNVANPDVQNPDVQNPDVQNPDVQNPDVQNPDVQNPDVQNPDVQNSSLDGSNYNNPDTEFQGLSAAERAGGYTDVTWEMENDGNTTTAFNYDAFVSGETNGLRTQLIGSRTNYTETVTDCMPVLEVQNRVVFNLLDPDLSLFEENTTAGIFGDGSAYVAPGERFFVTLRIWGDADFPVERTGLRVEAQSCNSAAKGPGTAECDPPSVQIGSPDAPPVISGPESPVAVEVFSSDEFVIGFVDEIITVSDDVDESVALSCNSEDVSSGPWEGFDSVNVRFGIGLGSIVQVDCTATDQSGNTADASFVFEGVDTTPPQLFIGDDITEFFFGIFSKTDKYKVFFLGEDLGQVFAPQHVSAFDAIDGDISDSIVCTPASGGDETVFRPPPRNDVGASRATEVGCVVEDSSGNRATGTFDVIVFILEPIL